MSNGLYLLAFYVWSKSIDITGSTVPWLSSAARTAYNLHAERSVSVQDYPNAIKAFYRWKAYTLASRWISFPDAETIGKKWLVADLTLDQTMSQDVPSKDDEEIHSIAIRDGFSSPLRVRDGLLEHVATIRGIVGLSP